MERIGRIGGAEVLAVTLTGPGGLRIRLLSYGARMAELWVPDRAGQLADIVLGHDGLSDWQSQPGYVGATCGRYANRIAGGRFALDGREVQLDRNEGAQTLHGGSAGFDGKLWTIESHDAAHVTFATTSADGEMGFPGALTVRTSYHVSDLGLSIEMTATTDAPTVVNMANHAYFNLAGQGSGDVLGQNLRLHAGHYLPVDETLIPTGEILAVAGTPFDFRAPRAIGAVLPGPGGFDHNFCLSAPLGADGLRPVAEAHDPASGRRLRLRASEPGVQVYTGAHFSDTPGKAGARYGLFAGFALETQGFPNAPNVPHFPPTRLEPGRTYRHRMMLDLTPLGH